MKTCGPGPSRRKAGGPLFSTTLGRSLFLEREADATEPPVAIEIELEQGVPVTLDGAQMDGVELTPE